MNAHESPVFGRTSSSDRARTVSTKSDFLWSTKVDPENHLVAGRDSHGVFLPGMEVQKPFRRTPVQRILPPDVNRRSSSPSLFKNHAPDSYGQFNARQSRSKNSEPSMISAVYDEVCDDDLYPEFATTDWKTDIAKPTATLYALLLIISNIALSVASQTRPDSNHIPITYSKWFDAILYGLSILYLLYAMIFLFRDEDSHLGVSSASDRLGQKAKDVLAIINPFKKHGRYPTTRTSEGCGGADFLHKRYSIRPGYEQTAYIRTRGSVYLKINAIICGVGAMIYSCLEFGVWISDRQFKDMIVGILPLLVIVYVSLQTYFIFLHSKKIIHRHTILSRFGLMHLVATDVTIWLRVLIDQTLYEFSAYRTQDPNVNTNASASDLSTQKYHGSAQYNEKNHEDLTSMSSLAYRPRETVLGDVLVKASVFLYPCIIGYAVISAGIVYVMCRNMGNAADMITTTTYRSNDDRQRGKSVDGIRNFFPLERLPSVTDASNCVQCRSSGSVMHSSTTHRLYWLDCDQAVGGLLTGSIVLAMTIVCLILFFIFKNHNPELAMLEGQIGEIILYSLGIAAVSVAFVQAARKLPKHGASMASWELDSAMLLVSVMGVYAFCVLSIIGSNDDEPGTPTNTILMIVASSLAIIQCTLQVIYIFEASHRSIPQPSQDDLIGRKKIEKPGRNSLTFLIVINLAFWCMNIFKTLRSEDSPVQQRFFGVYEWTIITHVTVPLQLLYRFHSAASLFEIWKHAYKIKQQAHVCRHVSASAPNASEVTSPNPQQARTSTFSVS